MQESILTFMQWMAIAFIFSIVTIMMILFLIILIPFMMFGIFIDWEESQGIYNRQ